MSIPSGMVNGLRGLVVGILAGSGAADADTASMANLALAPIGWFVGVVAQAFFMGGVIQFALSVVRGRKPEFGEVFSGGKTFGQMFVGSLLFSFAGGLGFVACIVPGVIFFLGCQFYSQEIVDKQRSAVDALKRSWEITTGHKLNLFVLALFFLGIGLLGLAACCIGALLVSAPVVVIATAYVYLKLTGEEPTAIV